MKTNKEKYEEGKARAIKAAHEWQARFINGDIIYWSEIIEEEARVYNLARRYGLVREFGENGII